MDYQERLPPEGINTSKNSPLKEFTILLGGLILVTVVSIGLIAMFAGTIATYVPFEVELVMAESYADEDAETPAEVAAYLASLTEHLAALSDLPPGMRITMHYVDDDMVNAFATLGGNIVIFRGLLEKMPNENVLAMVVAHEIAHVKHRDPIASLARGVLVQLALNAVTGSSNADLVLGTTGLLTLLSFNRDMEEDADEQALRTLNVYYGHVACAAELFAVLHDSDDMTNVPEFFSTHPMDERRIEDLNGLAVRKGWSTRGKATPLPLAVTTGFDPASSGL